MSDFPAQPAWADAQEIAASLIDDGWLSPDTYSRHFASLIDGPSIYLFLLYQKEDFRTGLVAYVGMSKNVRQRVTNHNILPELWSSGYWPQRWFRPTPEHDLRDAELEHIHRFDPPWNIAGRRRGIALT